MPTQNSKLKSVNSRGQEGNNQYDCDILTKIDKPEPIDLDGSGYIEGKGKRATFSESEINDLMEDMEDEMYLKLSERYKYYICEPSLSFTEMLVLEEYDSKLYHMRPFKERFLIYEQWSKIQERVVFDDEKSEADFQNRMSFLRDQKRKQKVHAGHELGVREFTLTYSPDWFDDIEAQFQMKRAIERLCSYYEREIVYLKAIGERTKQGRVHIHCVYELTHGTKISDKNMKRAYKNWNGKFHHHQVVRDMSDFLGYIDKDSETAWFKCEVDNRKK